MGVRDNLAGDGINSGADQGRGDQFGHHPLATAARYLVLSSVVN